MIISFKPIFTHSCIFFVVVCVVSPAPVQQRELQDSQLFDAECSEPLLQEDVPPSPQRPVTSPARKNSASRPRGRPRGMDVDVLYGVGYFKSHSWGCRYISSLSFSLLASERKQSFGYFRLGFDQLPASRPSERTSPARPAQSGSALRIRGRRWRFSSGSRIGQNAVPEGHAEPGQRQVPPFLPEPIGAGLRQHPSGVGQQQVGVGPRRRVCGGRLVGGRLGRRSAQKETETL